MDRPCKECWHDEDAHFDGKRCHVVALTWGTFRLNECKCPQYEQMPNLEYLEYLHGKKGVK